MDKTAIIAIVAVSVLAVSGVALYAVNNSHNDSTTVDDSDGATTTTDDATSKFWTDMTTKLNNNGKSIKIGTMTKTIYHSSSHTTKFGYQNGFIIITETYYDSFNAITSQSVDWYRVTTVNTVVYDEYVNGYKTPVTLRL